MTTVFLRDIVVHTQAADCTHYMSLFSITSVSVWIAPDTSAKKRNSFAWK